jgi:hypothetical protein
MNNAASPEARTARAGPHATPPAAGRHVPPNSQPASPAARPGGNPAPDQRGQSSKPGTALALRNEPPARRAASDSETDLAAFAKDLRELRVKAGLGYPEMAELSHYTMKTLAAAAGGLSLPTLPVTAAYVRACEGNVAEWEDRWHRVADAIKPARDGAATPESGRTADGAGRGSSPDAAASGRPAGDGPDDGTPNGAAPEPSGRRAPRPSQVASPRPAREGPSAPDPAPRPPEQRPDQVYVITSAAPRRPYR